MARNQKSIKGTALLTAAVLATSCFVGGTIARYVTTTMSEDTARVAIWGINADDVEMNLFDAQYDVNGNRVAKSWNGDKIIAPGTSMASNFSIVNLDDTLAPEVMYEIKVDVDDTEIDQRILDNPSIQWRLDNGTWGTWDETKADILALSGDASGVKTYQALEFADEFRAGKTHTIAWQWMLDDNHVQDTAMGNEAVDEDIIAKISVKVTARQVDMVTTGMLNGDGQTFNAALPAPLSFRSVAPVTEFAGVKVDGTEVANTNYTVSEGSTVITFNEDYLASLSVGRHEVEIISQNNIVSASFTVVDGVAKVGDTSYATLQEAIDEASSGATVQLISNASGSGVIINKDITIDFNNKTYTLTSGVGSTGTESNGFQLLQNNNVTFKNGTLEVSPENANEFYILLQNYSNLTVKDMKLDGTNLDKWSSTDGDSYVISNNSGIVNITGKTDIIANNDGSLAYAFDACEYSTYSVPTVNVSTTGTVTGKIEVVGNADLNISNGTYSVAIEDTWCADGYAPVDNGNGTYSVIAE